MKRNRVGKGSGEQRVELKYCERCGGLWLRETGTGQVYCKGCRPEVAELPVPRLFPGGAKVPHEAPVRVEDYALDDYDIDTLKFEAAGGAA